MSDEVEKKVIKHKKILQCTTDLETAVTELEILESEINGTEREDSPRVAAPETLRGLLDEMPNYLVTLTDRIRTKTRAIRDLLF